MPTLFTTPTHARTTTTTTFGTTTLPIRTATKSKIKSKNKTYTTAPTTKSTPQHAIAGVNFDSESGMDGLTEATAPRMALDISRHEAEHRALAEQRRLLDATERERVD